MSTNDLRNVVRFGWEFISQFEDYVDGTTVEPGMLMEETSDGWQPHSTAGGVVDRVVVAKDMRGRGFEVNPEDDDVVYPDNEFITFLECNAGAGLTMLLATGEDLSGAYPGGETRLVSNGDGLLRQFSGDDPDDVVAHIAEAADASGRSDPLAVDVEVTR